MFLATGESTGFQGLLAPRESDANTFRYNQSVSGQFTRKEEPSGVETRWPLPSVTVLIRVGNRSGGGVSGRVKVIGRDGANGGVASTAGLADAVDLPVANHCVGSVGHIRRELHLAVNLDRWIRGRHSHLYWENVDNCGRRRAKARVILIGNCLYFYWIAAAGRNSNWGGVQTTDGATCYD